MACSIEGIKPEFVPPGFLCSDSYCDQLAELLVNESALDELWRAQGFPTPPSTPERVYTSSSNLGGDLDTDSESDSGQEVPLLNELVLLAYGEDILANNPVAFPPLTMATESSDEEANLQDNLIQDCMWSGGHCERLTNKKSSSHSSSLPPPLTGLRKIADGNDGAYTPAPSPPPSASGVVVGGDSSHDDEGMESDCVSPSAVFPSLLTPPASATGKLIAGGVGSKVDQSSTTVATETKSSESSSGPSTSSSSSSATLSPVKMTSVSSAAGSRTKPSDDPDWDEWVESGIRSYERGQRRNKRKLSTMAIGTGGNSRQQPQSESSTSDEEIDVVTVTSADRTKVPRKRCHSSLSAPCSRQTSPLPKRRKYHTKRLQRLGSAGSAVGENADSEDEARRASHNVLERKRRNDLKSSFQRLREEIPELEENQRAPKVTILKKAMEYIRRMQSLEQESEADLVAERKRKADLVARLNKLRSGSGSTN